MSPNSEMRILPMNAPRSFLPGVVNFWKRKKTSLQIQEPKHIDFSASDELTLGVEIEMQIIDPRTLNLTPKAGEILKATTENKKIKPEVYLSMLEINTGICQDVTEATRDLDGTMAELKSLQEKHGVSFCTTATHPSAKYADRIITQDERYIELIDRNQWLTRRWSVYGVHVHLGMKSGDDCIRFNNFLLRFMPHFLALSASSPFWQGEDTGLASCRPTVFEAMPTSGTPYFVKDWPDFEQLCMTLMKSKSIKSMKDLWWDIRPSPGYGTLEIRICDGIATMAETSAVVAFIHALACWFRDHGEWIDRVPLPPRWILRENKWRVIRHGLDADLVVGADGALKPLRQDIMEWLDKLDMYIRRLGYTRYIGTLTDILNKGTSTDRQRAVYQKEGSLDAVVRHNLLEFNAGVPDWSPVTEQKSLQGAA
jgi:glutamate---cysteine ligase / carboxylate-amine ligase